MSDAVGHALAGVIGGIVSNSGIEIYIYLNFLFKFQQHIHCWLLQTRCKLHKKILF